MEIKLLFLLIKQKTIGYINTVQELLESKDTKYLIFKDNIIMKILELIKPFKGVNEKINFF